MQSTRGAVVCLMMLVIKYSFNMRRLLEKTPLAAYASMIYSRTRFLIFADIRNQFFSPARHFDIILMDRSGAA